MLASPATVTAAAPAGPVGENARAGVRVVVHLVAVEQPEALDAKIAAWFLGQTGTYTSVRQEHFQASELFRAQSPGVHVFVTRPNADELRIFFVCSDGPKQRYLVRDLPLTRGLDEVAMENTAQVVFSATLAVWEGREETTPGGVSAKLAPDAGTAPPPEAVTRTPEPPPSTSPRATVARDPNVASRDERTSAPLARPYLVASAGYALRYRGPGGVAHGPLLGLGIGRGNRREIGARISGALLLPITVESQDLDLKLRGYSLALEPWLELGREGSARFVGSLALGMDIVNASPSVSSTGIDPTPPSWQFDPFLAPRVGAYFALGSLQVGVALDLTVQFVQRHYDIAEAGQQQAWLTAWRVQPGLLVQAFWRGQ